MDFQAEVITVQSSVLHKSQTMLGISSHNSFCYSNETYCLASCSNQAFQSQETIAWHGLNTMLHLDLNAYQIVGYGWGIEREKNLWKRFSGEPYTRVLLKMVGPTVQNGDLSMHATYYILVVPSTRYQVGPTPEYLLVDLAYYLVPWYHCTRALL